MNGIHQCLGGEFFVEFGWLAENAVRLVASNLWDVVEHHAGVVPEPEAYPHFIPFGHDRTQSMGADR